MVDTWIIVLVITLPLLCISTSAFTLVYILRSKNRIRMSRASRLLDGILDPISPDASNPSILTDIDGCLLRISILPSRAHGKSALSHTYLEIVTPIDGSSVDFVTVVRDDTHCYEHLLDLQNIRQFRTERTITYSVTPVTWSEDVLAMNPSWYVLEIDDRLIRVLSVAPEMHRFNAAKIEHEVNAFRDMLPELLVSAGVERSSNPRRHDRW